MLNDMPPDEWEGYKADMIVAFIGAMVLLIALLIWLRIPPTTVLINEPCAPTHPVTVNGEKVGCTGDKPNPRPGYYPRGQRGADSYRNLHRQSVVPVSVLDRQNLVQTRQKHGE